MKKALITGILGQDGSYMAELLYRKEYEIYGIVKQDADENRIQWLKGLVPCEIYKIDITDKKSLSFIIRMISPDEIYNFAGIANVFNAWELLDSTIELNSKVPQYILEIINEFNKNIKFFQASSCLIFGRDTSGFQNENTPANPIYPYGISKLYADNMVREFRETFGLYACSGILFPHESPRRGDGFFVKKVTNAVTEIKAGKQQKIQVGNIDLMREYGYAPDYIEAIYLMIQNSKPADYVIGMGEPILLRDFIKKCFDYINLDYRDYIEYDKSLVRKTEVNTLRADTRKIFSKFGWKPTIDIDEMIKIMIK